MNHQIRKLAEQAGFHYIKDEGIGWAGNYNASLPKFAELIVRECARVIDRGNGELSTIAETAWCNGCRDDILKHFGVEE